MPAARDMLILLAAALSLAGCGRSDPRVPAGYPRGYGDLLRQADGERRLLIWSATDKVKTQPLIDAFRRAHPALAGGGIEFQLAEGEVILLTRDLGNERIVCAFNLGAEPVSVDLGAELRLQPLTGHGFSEAPAGRTISLGSYGAWFARAA
ncbi:MAG: alpha-glucosidase [Sphingomonas bacterium]|nr:alpha-glucosidase [Sphingomonas bacterium]